MGVARNLAGEDATDEVPGYRLRGLLAQQAGSRLHRAEALGAPGRPLLVEVHDAHLEGPELEALRARTAAVRQLGHPGLLPVLEVVALPTGVALVMPTVVGGSLADALDATAPTGLDEATIGALRTTLADAVHSAHEHGIQHGAITADTIRFDACGHPLLLGLGTGELRGAPPAADDAARDRRDLARLIDSCRLTGAVESPDPPADGAARRGRHLPPQDEREGRPAEHDPRRAIRPWLLLAAVGVLTTPLLLVMLAVTAG